MAGGIFEVEVKLTGVEGLKQKQINDAIKQAMHDVGLRWRRRYLPLHFGGRAATRYGYTPRAGERGDRRKFQGSYTARKLRFLKHTRPLEYTGEGKRLALNGPQLVRATRDRVVVPLPRKFNWRHPKSKVNMADEIRAVREDERAELNEFLVAQIERHLNAAKHRGSAGSAAAGGTRLRDSRGRFITA